MKAIFRHLVPSLLLAADLYIVHVYMLIHVKKCFLYWLKWDEYVRLVVDELFMTGIGW
jgi:hypothetical protein